MQRSNGSNQSTASGAERPGLPRGDGQRILVAVQDPGESELLTTTLDLAGYRYATACDAAELMARFAPHVFDLVIVDVALPGLAQSGRGRRVPPAERPPTLFVTAHESLPTVVEELGIGTVDYVTKPIRIAEVLARTKVLLRGRDRGGEPAQRDSAPTTPTWSSTTPPAWPAAATSSSTSRPPNPACCATCW